MKSPILAVVLVLGFLAVETKGQWFAYDAVYDLQNNIYNYSPYVTGGLSLLSGSGCSRRGTLKIALASATADPQRRRVLIDLFFSNPKDWTFNLGDSDTNNGWGGDGATQGRDAEVFSINSTLLGWLSDFGGSVQAFQVNNVISYRLTLLVGDGFMSWLPDNSNLYNYYYNDAFFALNGQPENSQGSPNYDLYLGVNQVITGSSSRTGSGLCKVGIKFLPEIHM